MSAVEVNGQWPEFTGKVLQELIVQEFWYEGVLEEQANVVYLKVAGQWFRLYFDSGIVFWRECDEGFESERIARADDAIYPLVDLAETLGLKGVTIVSCGGRLISNGSEIEFAFQEEKPLIFQCVDDNTSVKVQ